MIVCVNCSREMTILQMDDIGVPVLLLDANGDAYRLAHVDIATCTGCDARVTHGAGKPWERHEIGFDSIVKAALRDPRVIIVK